MLDHIRSHNFGYSYRHPSRFRRWVYKIIPAHIWSQLRFEILAFRTRSRHRAARKKFRGRKDLLVNIGAGPCARPGWVNLDVTSEGGNIQYDCRKSLPFESDSVRGVFAEHFLEHLDYTEEAPVFLAECLRVLESGGVIRIVVPDGEKYLKA